MRYLYAPLGSAVLLISCGLAQSGGDDGRAVVAKAIQAIGGEANLAKFKAYTVKDKGKYYGMGDGQPYNGVMTVQHPGQLRMEIEGVFTMIVNGDKGWIQAGGQTIDMKPEQIAAQKVDRSASLIIALWPLKDKAFQLKPLDDAKVGKHHASVVQVTRKNYPDVKLYFDKTSNLLIKAAYRNHSQEANKVVDVELFFSEFRAVEGVKMPHKLALKHDGKLFVESETVSMKAHDKLDAKTFAKPAAE
jgi:hypothetical protein